MILLVGPGEVYLGVRVDPRHGAGDIQVRGVSLCRASGQDPDTGGWGWEKTGLGMCRGDFDDITMWELRYYEICIILFWLKRTGNKLWVEASINMFGLMSSLFTLQDTHCRLGPPSAGNPHQGSWRPCTDKSPRTCDPPWPPSGPGASCKCHCGPHSPGPGSAWTSPRSPGAPSSCSAPTGKPATRKNGSKIISSSLFNFKRILSSTSDFIEVFLLSRSYYFFLSFPKQNNICKSIIPLKLKTASACHSDMLPVLVTHWSTTWGPVGAPPRPCSHSHSPASAQPPPSPPRAPQSGQCVQSWSLKVKLCLIFYKLKRN